jgi:hypothetical protein
MGSSLPLTLSPQITPVPSPGDLCKTSPFAQLLRQAQILSLEILNVFLRLKFSPSLSACNAQAGLNLSKIEHFSKVSPGATPVKYAALSFEIARGGRGRQDGKGQRSEVGSRRSEDKKCHRFGKRQRSEDRCQMSEGQEQETEIRRLRRLYRLRQIKI